MNFITTVKLKQVRNYKVHDLGQKKPKGSCFGRLLNAGIYCTGWEVPGVQKKFRRLIER